VDWIGLAQVRNRWKALVNSVLNLRVPWNSGKLTSFLFLCPQVADGLPGIHKAEILGLCDEVDILSRQLSDLCRRGHGDTPQAQDVARYISGGVNLLLITNLYKVRQANFLFWTEWSEGKRKLACCTLYKQCVLLTYDLTEVTKLVHYLSHISRIDCW
jgi:hypothetical protein